MWAHTEKRFLVVLRSEQWLNSSLCCPALPLNSRAHSQPCESQKPALFCPAWAALPGSQCAPGLTLALQFTGPEITLHITTDMMIQLLMYLQTVYGTWWTPGGKHVPLAIQQAVRETGSGQKACLISYVHRNRPLPNIFGYGLVTVLEKC
jgi:hypothetical protein